MKRALLLAAGLALAGCVLTTAGPSVESRGRWLRGDLHVHDDHSSDGSLPRQRARDRAKGNVAVGDQIGRAEDVGLQFLPLTDHRTYDQHYDPTWESAKLLLIPGEEANGSPHATVHGGVDSIVQGAAREGSAFAHIQQSIWDAHSQGATWTIAHPDDGETNEDGTPNERASVQGADLVEIWNRASDIEKEIDYSENRWNAGFRFGVAGASDSHFREYWERQGPGFPTTSVLAKAANERGVLDALRAGRTSLSINPAGAFVELTTDMGGGRVGGDEVIAPAGTKGRLGIRVQRAAGMEVRLYRSPGRSAGAFRTFVAADDDETFAVDVTSGDQPEWYRVEVRGMSVATETADGQATGTMELKAIASPLFISPAPVEARPELALPADRGADDGAMLVAGGAGAFAGFPDVAAEGGFTHVVAETHGPGTSAVTYRRRDDRQRWSGERVLSGDGIARFPRVAARGRNVWVVWQEDAMQIPHRPVIRMRRSGDGGATWRPAETVRAIEGRAEHPDIAITPIGRAVLVWQEIRAGEPFDVMAWDGMGQPRNLSRPGKAFGSGEADDTRSARYPASVWPTVAAAPDGRVAVAWQDNRTDADPLWTGSAAAAGTNPDDWQVQVVTRDAGGTWSAPASLGAADMADRHPDVAFAGSGELVAAWESKTLAPAGRNLSVLAAVSGDGGATFAAPAMLAPDAAAMSQRPRLGLDADGAVRAAWHDSRSADWRWRVMTSAWRRGAGWDAGRMVDGRGNNTWPATSGGEIAFASTRNASRLQRDATQQVFVVAGD